MSAVVRHEPELRALLAWAMPRLGLRWDGFRGLHRQVGRRIARRAHALGLASLAAYRARLEDDPGEWAALDALCRVTISRFYRDATVFDHLRAALLPALAEQARARGATGLRAWSAGCASGEEAYTLAIVWRAFVAARFPGLPLQVIATDRGDDVLARARAGVFDAASLGELPAALREAGFVRDHDRFRVRDEIRAGIGFCVGDVRVDVPEGPLDLVLCRNVAFTYFDEPTQRAFLGRLVPRMVPGGALVIGRRERLAVGTPGLAPIAGLPEGFVAA